MSTPTPRPEPGLLLRLSGPLQSWGEHSHFNDRDTAAFPTRSGVIGMLAAALGRPRGDNLDDLSALRLTVRTDRPGVELRDLHTVGGGLPTKDTVTTASGKKRGGDTSTLLSHRTYLADAAFTIALTTDPAHEDPGLLSRCAEALRSPQWPLYLGRRSCPPEGPLLLFHSDDALHHLIHLPLAASRPHRRGVEFLSDRLLDQLPVSEDQLTTEVREAPRPSSQVLDEPISFHPRRRAHRTRALYRRSLHLPAHQYGGLGTDQLQALHAYMAQHLTPAEGKAT